MTKCRTIEQVRDLLSNDAETPWLEFKENYGDPNGIGKRIAGLSNSARLEDRDCAFMVWGIRDNPVELVGTDFDPRKILVGNQGFEIWLDQKLTPKLALQFKQVKFPGGEKVVLLEIPAAASEPTRFAGTTFARVGSATTQIQDNDPRHKLLQEKLRPYTWETGLAATFVTPEDALRLLDYDSFFDLMKEKHLDEPVSILKRLAAAEVVVKDVGCRWNITNLGAILFARDLTEFDSSLARKAVRIVTYAGNGRSTRHIWEHEERQGYAPSFARLVSFIENQIPTLQYMEHVRRISEPMVPIQAVREALTNALIHQDMTITGTGPLVEVFGDRVEIRNPGGSLVEPDRMIDSTAKSRNEKMANLMRRMGFCEELGSGVDLMFAEVEARQLPAPLLQCYGDSMAVTLYGPRAFADMNRNERLRACYFHAVLCWVHGFNMKNATLRQRFGVEPRNAAQISAVIKGALDAGLIKVANEEHPRSGYIPFWL